MKWRTEVKVPDNKGFLRYEHVSLSIGSCFSEEIGKRLKESGFDISVNPFGVIFNPVSIMQLIQNALDGETRENLLLERDMKFFHYGYHSSLFGFTREEILDKIETTHFTVQKRLLEGDRLFLTFGSAWVYRLVEQGVVVANCHKMPSQLFTKELIDLNKLREFSERLFSKLFELNPKLEIVLTVSPVRHSRDGLHENNLSKSVLHLFCKQLTESFDQINYFPSYELVVDELRDYRFYKEDLVHPTQQAIEFVFENFRKSNFDEPTEQKFLLHEQLRKAENHLFLNATIEEVRKHEEYIAELKQKLAGIEQ